MNAKRILDIVGACCGLGFLVLVFPFVALAIVLDDGWPVLVKLPRVSRGRIIHIYKFRSMVRGAEKMKNQIRHLNRRDDGPLFKAIDDPRITKTGRWLRKTRLDEFPQFINVFKGELSLVGPRPHEPEELLSYPPRYWPVFLIKAGITGPAQVAARPFLPFEKEVELDLSYLRQQSLLFDLKLILKTVWIFFTLPDGV